MTTKLAAGPISKFGLHEPMFPLLILWKLEGIPVARKIECPFVRQSRFQTNIHWSGSVIEEVGLNGPLLSRELVCKLSSRRGIRDFNSTIIITFSPFTRKREMSRKIPDFLPGRESWCLTFDLFRSILCTWIDLQFLRNALFPSRVGKIFFYKRRIISWIKKF